MFGIGKSDVAYSILSIIEQSNAATNPYFAISKSKTALEMVFFYYTVKRTLLLNR